MLVNRATIQHLDETLARALKQNRSKECQMSIDDINDVIQYAKVKGNLCRSDVKTSFEF